jgi:hypothetical protein
LQNKRRQETEARIGILGLIYFWVPRGGAKARSFLEMNFKNSLSQRRRGRKGFRKLVEGDLGQVIMKLIRLS